MGYSLALLGLTGLVDNVVEWHGAVSNIISEYQAVRDFIFGWFPFSVPNLVKDYLVVGVGISTIKLRATWKYLSANHAKKLLFGAKHGSIFQSLGKLVLWPGYVIIWPWLVLMYLDAGVGLLRMEVNDEETEIFAQAIVDFWKRFLLLIFIYIGVLFVFSDLLTKLSGG